MICSIATKMTFLDTFAIVGCTLNGEWYQLSIHCTMPRLCMLLHKHAAAMLDSLHKEGNMCHTRPVTNNGHLSCALNDKEVRSH